MLLNMIQNIIWINIQLHFKVYPEILLEIHREMENDLTEGQN